MMGCVQTLPINKVTNPFLSKVWIYVIFTIIFFCFHSFSIAQRVAIRGSISDAFTKEKIPFASIHWKKAKYGVMSDSAGNFRIVADGFTHDTLLISYVGLELRTIAINTKKDTGFIKIIMETSKSE